MSKLYLEEPTMERKEDAIDYINEHLEYGSDINGSGGLDRYLDNYEGWLEKLENDRNMTPNSERVPALTYFLVREDDKRIIGMINIRLCLNERLRKTGGNIGYGIRPTERKKGYNKINLYLALQICQEYGLDKVLLDADLDNPASWRTMEALGGTRINTYYDENYQCDCVKYEIDVEESLKNNEKTYVNQIKR